MTAGSRMRRQSANAVLDDCVAKLDEVFARQGAVLPADLRTHTAGIVDAMWQQVDESTSQASSGGSTSAAPRGASRVAVSDVDPLVVPDRFASLGEMASPTEPVQWNESWARPGDEEIRLGAIMMPLGLVTCGLLLIVGIIVLVVGEEQNGSWDGQTHGE